MERKTYALKRDRGGVELTRYFRVINLSGLGSSDELNSLPLRMHDLRRRSCDFFGEHCTPRFLEINAFT